MESDWADLGSALEAARGCGFNIDSGIVPLGEHRMHRVVKLEPGWEDPLPLDLMLAERGTYEAAYASRHQVANEDGGLWLVTRDGLIDMKREAARPIDQQGIERIG